jgi:hypothetical protein
MTADELVITLLPVVERIAAREVALRKLSHPFDDTTLKQVRADIRLLRRDFDQLPAELRETLESPLVGESSESLHRKLQEHTCLMTTWLRAVIAHELEKTEADKRSLSETSASVVEAKKSSGDQDRETSGLHFGRGRLKVAIAGVLLIALYFAFADETSLTRLIAMSIAWLCGCWFVPARWIKDLE